MGLKTVQRYCAACESVIHFGTMCSETVRVHFFGAPVNFEEFIILTLETAEICWRKGDKVCRRIATL